MGCDRKKLQIVINCKKRNKLISFKFLKIILEKLPGNDGEKTKILKIA